MILTDKMKKKTELRINGQMMVYDLGQHNYKK